MCSLYLKSGNIYRNKLLKSRSIFLNCSRTLSSQNIKLPFNAYQPKNLENRNLELSPNSNTNEKFSMIFPPPNVTGNIHLGHVLTSTIQDALVRWHHKNGKETLWIPGMDHAGIATQVVVEKIIQKEFGKSRHELGREQFLKEVWKWKNEKGSTITADLKTLGTSFNWDREYFTMNEKLSKIVNEAFVRLFDKNLIYRDKSLVNWSCCLESAISDIEVENMEISGPTSVPVPNYNKNVMFGQITEFAYKIVDSEEEIVVSTTRPETMLGDVAVAVHPDDPRYNQLRNFNVKLWHPFRKQAIPLIFDEYADPEFGTGAVKITPSHDKNDFLVAKRHELPHCPVINEKGLIMDDFQEFAGLPRFECREKVLNELANLGLLKETKSHKMILPICSRSKDIVEFLLRPQWFVKCDEMAKRAVQAVESGQLKIIPPNFESEWFRWLNNCRDWCISRQLWWGHQIPAFKVNADEDFWIAAHSLEEAKEKVSRTLKTKEFTIEQDHDVLDTWFSSALLSFSVFDWPENNRDFQKYFPLDLMETGHDILFFWVARMVMLSQELTGQLPFNEILLHGIICDAQGRKMSKSLGNTILPKHVIDGITLEGLEKETEHSMKKGILSQSEMKKSIDGQKKMFPNGIPACGTDALRFTLCSYNIKNHFINFDVQECYTNKLFFNKIWQATKYTIQGADNVNVSLGTVGNLNDFELTDMDRWILSRLDSTKKMVEKSLSEYNFHMATNALKTFFYNNFCDVYLETTKQDFNLKNERAVAHCHVLGICLSVGLDLMEIFTPFLTGELKKYLPAADRISMGNWEDEKLECDVRNLLEICGCIRQLKNELKISRKIDSTVHIFIKDATVQNFLESHQDDLKCLTFSDKIKFSTNLTNFEALEFAGKSTAGHLCSFGISLATQARSTKRMKSDTNVKKLEKLEQELEKLEKTVSSDGYQKSANPKVKEKHLERIAQLKSEIESIRTI